MAAKYRFISFLLILAGLGIAYFDGLNFIKPDSFLYSKILAVPYRLGLDLQGGVHLTYKADVSAIKDSEVDDAMGGLRDVIERRVNFFGVAEPIVQVEKGSVLADGKREQRLIVELPGVSNVNEAIKMIGETPFLEFRTENPDADKLTEEEKKDASKLFLASDLTGRYLKKAILEFDQTTFEPTIALEFNKEGGDMFASLTKDNVGKSIAIFLDGAPISIPVVREEITGGRAQISGQFAPKDAKLLVQRLNSGALPVPVSLMSQQSVGPTLGEKFLAKGIIAGIYGMALVSIFLLVWYRLPGLIAVVALLIYTVIVLALFKLIPVTLTAAGIAGFILSIGMAVDANILIFERMKEELKKGKTLTNAIAEGFSRAWLSIRDSNISSLITAGILFWMGTSMIKGFALTLGIGILVSMFSAITVSRSFLFALMFKKSEGRLARVLFGSGIK
ncbi:protein translocase subunit SecD [Candidatus Parcubacteria bacterium]|nr:MAG: protein translocase subunit SecD [Candidatus Parcubacteria bacterium]